MGAAFRIDTRNISPIPLFQWYYRPAGSTTETMLMNLTAAGNLGLGVSPTQKLDVNGTIKATGFVMPTGAGAGKVLTSNASGTATWQTPATGSSQWTTSGTNIYFNSGNVGIGLTNPLFKLHVSKTADNYFYYTDHGLCVFFKPSGGTSSEVRVGNAWEKPSIYGSNNLWLLTELNKTIYFGSSNSESMRLQPDGKLAIGGSTLTTPGTYRLYVADGILTEKVKVAVKTTANWADYVFAPDYQLKPLLEVESFITENKHLPGVPSAEEVVEQGIDMATMDAKLLEKIEELTLYMIDMNKKVEVLQKENESLRLQINSPSNK